MEYFKLCLSKLSVENLSIILSYFKIKVDKEERKKLPPILLYFQRPENDNSPENKGPQDIKIIDLLSQVFKLNIDSNIIDQIISIRD